MFNISEEILNKQQATNTTKEIRQQPQVWQELITGLRDRKNELDQFINSIYTKHDQVRVVFTGAGTSAFIGDILAPELSKQADDKVRFEAIPTTDIVSNPTAYLTQEIPTILVSFARSGNSPESLASVSLGEQLVDDFYQVVVTCNAEGGLAKNIEQDEKAITILTPDAAHDQGLAMTSSFTCMMIAAYTLFTKDGFADGPIKQIIDNAEVFSERVGDEADDILQKDFNRIAYLGSGSLAQLSHEASLKMLELTAGNVVSMFESSLGFRHGPKSILNDASVVVLFLSQDAYTRKYDMDMLRELSGEAADIKVVAVTDQKDEAVEELADQTVVVNQGAQPFTSDFHLAFQYIMLAQVLAVKKSLALDITPDNPSPTGAINRVVQGVTIHSFNQ